MGLKIIALEIENFKKISAVEIRPDGNLVEISGKNANGKSSVLDSIWVALAGLSASPVKPIREGQSKAIIKVDLGEIVVIRTFKAGKDGDWTTSLVVENADGSKFSSPQKMLDELFGKLSFDPLEFARMEPKAQFNTLRQFVPGVDFEAIEVQNKADYERRASCNKKAKEARTLADSIVIQIGVPVERLDTKKLMDQLQEASKHNGEIEIRKTNRVRLAKEVTGIRTAIIRHQEEIARLQALVGELTAEADGIQKKLDSAGPLPEPIDISELRKQIDNADEINKQISMREEKQEQIEIAQSLEKESAAYTAIMDKREADKIKAISNAKLPVPGISFGNGEILMNNLPFNQSSDAEQLRASIAIAMAMNPKLKVIRVRDGSLLDEDSMKILTKMANDSDTQVWIERVGEGKFGFILENGHLKNQQPEEGEPDV